MKLKLGKLFRKVEKAAKSDEGRVAIAVAKEVLPIAAPKAVAKGVKAYRKAKALKDLAE